PMKTARFLVFVTCTVVCIATALGCAPSDNNSSDNQLKGPGRIQWAQFYDPLRPQALNPPINLRSARNETISLALQINSPGELASRRSAQLRLTPISAGGAAISVQLAAW